MSTFSVYLDAYGLRAVACYLQSPNLRGLDKILAEDVWSGGFWRWPLLTYNNGFQNNGFNLDEKCGASGLGVHPALPVPNYDAGLGVTDQYNQIVSRIVVSANLATLATFAALLRRIAGTEDGGLTVGDIDDMENCGYDPYPPT